jgi:magnesium-transporting ATPase (P-type)
MMSSICETLGEKILFTKGAAEVIFEKTTHYIDNNGNTAIFDDEAKRRMREASEAFEEEAYRVLAIGKNSGLKEDEFILLGLVAIMDLPREEVAGAIELCKTAGIRTMMITGDNPKTAQAIARKIGLDFDTVLTGIEVEHLSDEELENRLKKETILFARMASNQNAENCCRLAKLR